ncbi:hypothetical protein, partial [Rhizobium sp. SGZ-381]|uniref:hypothetical protein n=1 Tax=Rhizobium sp. SGZ-381 TaxID=3342800 RepID=UPI00366DAC5B
MTDIALIREALTDPEIASYPDFVGAVSTALDEIETLRAALREYVCDCAGPCHAETYGGPCRRAAFAALNQTPPS